MLGRSPDARILGCRPTAVLDCAPQALYDLARLTDAVEIGFDARGFLPPELRLGVMTDPGWPDGLLIGHGGGGPGYAAAAFAVVRKATARSSPWR